MRSLIANPRRFSLAGDLDSMFNAFFSSPVWQDNDTAFVPAVDIAESTHDYTLTLEVPGVDKKDVKISV